MLIKNYRIILLNGPSSSGKSSLSYALKALLKEQKNLNYQIVSIDDFMKIDKDETIYEDDVFEISSDMCDKVIEYLKTNDGVIIDHVITSERIYKQLLDRTSDYNILKVHVTCPLNELIKRESKRGDRCIGSAESSYQYLYPRDGYDIMVDTFEHSTEECAFIILNRRILVVGCPGSGKSIFSKKLSMLLGIQRIHIDNLYWNKDKTHISREELMDKYNEVLKLDSFILDGNYISTLEYRLGFVDAVYFLDIDKETCIQGIKNRIGLIRDDLPWIENQYDGSELINTSVNKFEKETKPLIEELLSRHKNITIYRFKNRDEINNYLKVFSK